MTLAQLVITMLSLFASCSLLIQCDQWQMMEKASVEVKRDGLVRKKESVIWRRITDTKW